MSQEKEGISRRGFLSLIANSSIFVSLTGFGIVVIKYLTPNVLFEPPSKFKIGKQEDFPEDTTTFLNEKKLFIINREGAYRAVSAECTHLGCVVKLTADEQFHCPCHGSKFDMDGVVIHGPAQRSLANYKIGFSRDKQLEVDVGKIVESDYRLTI